MPVVVVVVVLPVAVEVDAAGEGLEEPVAVERDESVCEDATPPVVVPTAIIC